MPEATGPSIPFPWIVKYTATQYAGAYSPEGEAVVFPNQQMIRNDGWDLINGVAKNRIMA